MTVWAFGSLTIRSNLGRTSPTRASPASYSSETANQEDGEE